MSSFIHSAESFRRHWRQMYPMRTKPMSRYFKILNGVLLLWVNIWNSLFVALKYIYIIIFLFFKCKFMLIQKQIPNQSIDQWTLRSIWLRFELFSQTICSVVFIVVAILYSFHLCSMYIELYIITLKNVRTPNVAIAINNTIYLLSLLENWKYLTGLRYRYSHFWVHNTHFAQVPIYSTHWIISTMNRFVHCVKNIRYRLFFFSSSSFSTLVIRNYVAFDCCFNRSHKT